MEYSKEELTEIQEILKRLEKNTGEMEKFNELFKIIMKDYKKLESFYTEKWLKYYDNYKDENDEFYDVLHEDIIFNILGDCLNETKDLIKTGAEIL